MGPAVLRGIPRNATGNRPPDHLYQTATPPWCEHVPWWCCEYDTVPSLHIAVGPPPGATAGAWVGRWWCVVAATGRRVASRRFGFGVIVERGVAVTAIDRVGDGEGRDQGVGVC